MIETLMRRIPDTDFEIGVYPVTQQLWTDVMRINNSFFANHRNRPVENIRWRDTKEFIAKLNSMTGQTYRLPTEKEWVIAAGTVPLDIEKYAWINTNSKGRTHKVGKKFPNLYGLYDMFGNVWEWTSTYYIETSTRCVLRGGSWYDDASSVSKANRRSYDPDYLYRSYGFRLARTID